jgi:hypothetical protein
MGYHLFVVVVVVVVVVIVVVLTMPDNNCVQFFHPGQKRHNTIFTLSPNQQVSHSQLYALHRRISPYTAAE